MTLVEFLLERIAEDKAAALACPPPGYTVDMGGARQYGEYVHTILSFAPEDGVPSTADRGGGVAMHFSRHDPARVLAECEAKRRIVEMVREVLDMDSRLDQEFGVSTDAPPTQSESLLLLLALPFADHPDYDEGWRP